MTAAAERVTPCLWLCESTRKCTFTRLAFPVDCSGCKDYRAGLDEKERTRCEVWSRVMGYHRPTSSFNAGKLQEHKDRQFFIERPGDLASDLEGRN